MNTDAGQIENTNFLPKQVGLIVVYPAISIFLIGIFPINTVIFTNITYILVLAIVLQICVCLNYLWWFKKYEYFNYYKAKQIMLSGMKSRLLIGINKLIAIIVPFILTVFLTHDIERIIAVTIAMTAKQPFNEIVTVKNAVCHHPSRQVSGYLRVVAVNQYSKTYDLRFPYADCTSHQNIDALIGQDIKFVGRYSQFGKVVDSIILSNNQLNSI